MPVKIVPREIAVEFRAYVVKYAFMIAIPIFIAIALASEAVNLWIKGNPGGTIIFGLVSFGFTYLATVFITIRIGKHEIQLNHSQEDTQFLTDAEAVQLGYMKLKDFMEDHKVMNAKMLRMYAQYLHEPIDELRRIETAPPSTAPDTKTFTASNQNGGQKKEDEVTHVSPQ